MVLFTTSRCRRSCNILCILALFFFFVYKDGIFQNPFSEKPFLKSSKIMLSDYETTICTEMHEHKGYDSECEYLKANPDCDSGGFLNYMVFFYCNCGDIKPLGFLVLISWLAVLFYLLGNTASDYFCCCLEMLSDMLKMPPTVAGVTLLPLGNGAPDVFSSIAAFVGRDSGDVGLNSVLGGSVFITCIVAGAISLCVADKNVAIDKKCFIRDVGVFIITLCSLLIILVVGEVSVVGAVTFVSIYVIYVGFVVANEILNNKYKRRPGFTRALLPVVGNAEDDDFEHPLLQSVPKLKVPHCLWNESVKSTNDDESPTYLWGWNEEEDVSSDQPCFSWYRLCSLLEIPLAIPRRLTIPVVEERRWSKAYAVASAFLSPILLALLWSSGDDGHIALCIGAVFGVTLGLFALILTRGDHPPRKFLFPWVMGGFLMSIVWFYIIANELVALLVDLGIIMSIKTSLLGLTILAWGNSMGDLMANVAIAINGSDGDGVQVAMSGCYAGPTFNTLVGLGISLLLGAWSERPNSYVLPVDSSLYLTLGFLTLGLIWSFVILPRNDMRPSKLLGIGLMIIYLGFLSFRVSIEMSGSIT